MLYIVNVTWLKQLLIIMFCFTSLIIYCEQKILKNFYSELLEDE